MAAGTRGKLKEHSEGIHRNCDWIKQHCEVCIGLIGDQNQAMSESFSCLGKLADELDKFNQNIYSHI